MTATAHVGYGDTYYIGAEFDDADQGRAACDCSFYLRYRKSVVSRDACVREYTEPPCKGRAVVSRRSTFNFGAVKEGWGEGLDCFGVGCLFHVNAVECVCSIGEALGGLGEGRACCVAV